MEIQYFIVIAIVIVVVIAQIKSFRENKKRTDGIKTLFNGYENISVQNDPVCLEYADNNVNNGFGETLKDINSYLKNNKNKTFDYKILKEIVDRKSKSLEDEIDTMLTVPLYLGLIATISGIAIGVFVFASNNHSDFGLNNGLTPLLIDVSIAMVASLVGVLVTMLSTWQFNSAKTEMDKNKNDFLTWIRSNLMPKLSDDIIGALNKMTQELNGFNETFAINTNSLKETLSSVRDNYENQVQLLAAIDRLKIDKIAKANIEVYDRLKGCTEELERLFEIFSNSETYVAKVIELNDRMGSIDERTKLFEELGRYYKEEVGFVKERQGEVRLQMNKIDEVLQDAVSNIGERVKDSTEDLTKNFQKQSESIGNLIEDQQRALSENLEQQQKAVNEKIGQIGNPFEGLKEIFENGVKDISSSFSRQNSAIEEMLSEQKKTLEKALSEQRQLLLDKLKESPDQPKVFSDLSVTLNELNNTLKAQKPHGTSRGYPEGLEQSSSHKPQGFWEKLKNKIYGRK